MGTLLVAAVLAGCSAPQHVTLADLVAQQEAYAGQQVETSGEVRAFHDPGGTYYVLEDANANRVQVRPADDVARYVGRQLTVVGRFDVLPDAGRVMVIESARAP